MIHEQRTSDQAIKSFERGSRLTGFRKYHGLDTGSKLRKYIFYADFLFRDSGIIKGNFLSYPRPKLSGVSGVWSHTTPLLLVYIHINNKAHLLDGIY